MEFLRDLGEWVVAMLEHWHGWVSGGVLAFGLEISDRIWDWKPSKRLFFVILATGFLYSTFSVWRDEHRAKLALDEPELSGRLELLGTRGGSENKVTIIATGEIINRGSPSVARNFAMSLKLTDGTLLEGIIVLPNKEDVRIPILGDPNHVAGFYAADWWPRSTISNPIPKGGAVPGWIMAQFSGITAERVRADKPKVIVSFTDIDEKPISIEKVFTGQRKEMIGIDDLNK
jgi:hypothetical protein